MSVANQNKKF